MQFSPVLVRTARKHAGLTQREVAEHAGVSVDTIRRAEVGSNEPSASNAAAIAAALGVSIDSLFTHDGDPDTTRDAVGEVHESQDPRPSPSEQRAGVQTK